jgi:phage/plasmid-associated DNA primase
MGQYGRTCRKGVLKETMNASHQEQLYNLLGRRLVICEELGVDEKLNSNQIKGLTGGGNMTASGKNKGEIEFRQQYKLMIASNNRPNFDEVDHAILRRCKLIQFETMFRDASTKTPYDAEDDQHRWRDAHLPSKMKTVEMRQQLLVWLAIGAQKYIQAGCVLPADPPSVSAFTDTIAEEFDLIGQFIEEHCTIDLAFVEDVSRDAEAYVQRIDRHIYPKKQMLADYNRTMDQHEPLKVFVRKVKARIGGRIGERKLGKPHNASFVGIRPVMAPMDGDGDTAMGGFLG